MIHPFAGIAFPSPELDGAEPAHASVAESAHQEPYGLLSRRTVLGWLSSVAVLPWLAARTLEGADKEGENNEDSQRALHYVVPKEGKKISPSVLKKLDICGGTSQGWSSRLQYAKTPGYWAWVDDAGAEKIRQEEAVETVEKFLPSDIQEAGGQAGAGTQRLMVQLAPNGWNMKPKRGSFLSAAELAKLWAKKVGDPKIMFRPAGLASVMVLSAGPMPDFVLNQIKESPQVISLQWGGGGGGQVTTRALGEEGNAPTQLQQEQGGGATTRAVGEEGGRLPNQPTTQALGEEGGR